MHITHEAGIALKQKFEIAQVQGKISADRTFVLGQRDAKEKGKTEFFAKDDQGKKYPKLGTIVGVVTICG